MTSNQPRSIRFSARENPKRAGEAPCPQGTGRKERAMSDHTDGIKATARRTLEEIFPNGDVAALAEVVHPDVVNHEAPPGAPQGLDGMTKTMLRLYGLYQDPQYEIHQVIADGDTVAVHCTFSGRHTGEFMGLAPTNRPFA